jgi:hypothetical protein
MPEVGPVTTKALSPDGAPVLLPVVLLPVMMDP